MRGVALQDELGGRDMLRVHPRGTPPDVVPGGRGRHDEHQREDVPQPVQVAFHEGSKGQGSGDLLAL